MSKQSFGESVFINKKNREINEREQDKKKKNWLIDFNGMSIHLGWFWLEVKEAYSLYVLVYIFCVVSWEFFFCTQLYDIKHSYLTEIICKQLYTFKYSYIILRGYDVKINQS